MAEKIGLSRKLCLNYTAALFALGDKGKMFSFSQKLVDNYPTDAMTWYCVGVTYLMRNKYSDAKNCFVYFCNFYDFSLSQKSSLVKLKYTFRKKENQPKSTRCTAHHGWASATPFQKRAWQIRRWKPTKRHKGWCPRATAPASASPSSTPPEWDTARPRPSSKKRSRSAKQTHWPFTSSACSATAGASTKKRWTFSKEGCGWFRGLLFGCGILFMSISATVCGSWGLLKF